MLVGGDLGFSLRVVVTAFVVLFGPVVGFVVRRKWQRAEARREEIKRLLVLASEEAVLAEIEATDGYGNDYSYGYSYDHNDGYGNGNGNGYDYGAVAEVEDQLSAVASGPAVAAVEAHAPVGNSQKLLYPCAVCACLTKSRCKQCKAVHYCSGKCQIIHWRQGHKDDCRPYSTTEHNNDLGVTSHLKISEHEGNGSYGNDVDFEGYSTSKSIEMSGEPAFSNFSQPTVHDRENDMEVEHLVGEKGRHPIMEPSNSSFNDLSASTGFRGSHNYASHDSDGPNQHFSDNSNVEKIQTGFTNIEQPKTSVSERPVLENAIDSVDSCKSSLSKSRNIEANGNFTRSAPNGFGFGGSDKSLLSEPSASSSGFWDGKLVRNRSRIDAPEGISRSRPSGANESSVSDSQYSFSEMNGTVVSHMETLNVKDVALDGSRPIVSKIKKPTNGTSLSVEESNVDLISRKLPKLTPKKSSDFDVSTSSLKSMSKPEEPGPLASGAVGKSTNGAIFMENGLPSLHSKKLNYDVKSRMASSENLELRKVESVSSKVSESSLSSHTERHAVRSMKVVKSDNPHGAAAYSLEQGGYQQNAKNVFKSSVLKVVDQFKASTLTKQNTSGASSEIVARYKGLFPYELFVKLYHSNSFEFRPCGLVNCGNSCYANTVLQCLAFTPPLTAYFLQGLHSKSCQKKDWCFTCEFENLVMNAKEGASPLSPIRIISHLQNIGSQLSNGREEDAHEFLRYAIEAMQSICLREAGIKESGSLGEETTLIGLTFGGYLRSKIECMRCGCKSERHERMMDLTVEIDGDIRTLEQALRQFTHAETLDGDNKYQCGRCKSYEKARKKLKVLEAPNVLTIVLKRFQSGKFGKLNKTIKFPEILDLAPYICGTSDKSPIYRLYGVVVHLDVMNAAFSGHYVCYVKNIQNKWYKADDSTVKAVELENVLTKGAYMLLYARCSPRAPRLIRSSLATRDPRKTKHHTCKPRSLSTGSWGVCAGDSSNRQACHECINSNHASSRPFGTISEEDSFSDNSSFFSEGGSCSADSSNRDSTSTEDHFDHILGDTGASWNIPWRNSSDSDTSSSSSSPSPLFSRHSILADSDRYASGYPETSGSGINNAEQDLDVHGFWARSATSSNLEVSDSKEDVHFSSRDSTNFFRKLVSSSRDTDANRLGRINPFRRSSERTGNLL